MTVKELIQRLEAMPGHLHVVCNAGPVRKIEFQPVKGWEKGTTERGIVVLKSAGEVWDEREKATGAPIGRPSEDSPWWMFTPQGRV